MIDLLTSMTTKPFYITTTIPYVNSVPHLGFALEIVQADVLARYKALQGCEVVFNTGTDDHGAKNYEKALEAGLEPQEYCNQMAPNYNRLKEALNLTYTHFIRTTDKHHLQAAQEFWKLCDAAGDIYKGAYQAKYCVGCELEKTDSELVEGKCPLHPNWEIELLDEENYFFRFSKYQQPLLDLYQNHPDFVVPRHRFKEIIKFVESGLRDFSVSRLKEKMPWGVPVPGDEEQVMYVWFDALVNYISTLGWPEDTENFQTYWGTKEEPRAIQVAGKDNLRQQSAMWQAMLMSAGLPNSKQILIHGFITANGQKMSKSLGNVIDPFKLVEKYGADAVRYYLLRGMTPFEDSDFTIEKFEARYNGELANGLGNLVSRVAKLCEGVKKRRARSDLKKIRPQVEEALDNYRFDKALDYIWNEKVAALDKLLEERRPWEVTGLKRAELLSDIVEGIHGIAYNLQPFLPEMAEKIRQQFAGPEIKAAEPPFPRLS